MDEYIIPDGVYPFNDDPGGEDHFTVIMGGEQVAWAATEAQAHRSYAEMLRVDREHGEV